tara:strand:+ start:1180 stop:1884 length:705 start_codon:yes stop_codon:yes gene_type:complete
MIGTMKGCIASSGVVTTTAFDGLDIVAAFHYYDSKFVDTFYIGAKTRNAVYPGFTESFAGASTAYDETNSSGAYSPLSMVGSFGTTSGGLVSAPAYPNRPDVIILGAYIEWLFATSSFRVVLQLAKPRANNTIPTTSVTFSNSQSSLSDGTIDVGSWPTSSFTLAEYATSVPTFVNHTTAVNVNNPEPLYNYSWREAIIGTNFSQPELLQLTTDFFNGVYNSATQFPAFRLEIT